MSPLDTAVFWTEFAARYAADVPAYQYANLDIIAVFLSFAIIVVKIFITVCGKKITNTQRSI